MSNQLYIVDYPSKLEYAEEVPQMDKTYDFSKIEKCTECGSYVSGGFWLPPRQVVLSSRKVPDFLYTYGGNTPFLLSKNALMKIQQAGLRGITFAEKIDKVSFQRKSKTEMPIPEYYFFGLNRSRITINHQKSEIIYGKSCGWLKKSCPLCRQVLATYDWFFRLSFNMEAYEGYDIFYTYEMGGSVLLSQRFVDFYKESGLTNLHFLPVEEYHRERSEYLLYGKKPSWME